LSVFLILHTFKTQNKIQFKYLILSGITFALAINVKLTAIEIVPLLLIIIFWRGSFNQKISFSQFKEKFFLSKSILLLCVFSVVVFSSVLVTNPYYYSNPIEQLKEQYDDLNTLSEMYEDNRPTWSPTQEYYMPFLGTTSVTFVPLLDTYYYIFDPENIPESASIGHTFTSVPLSILFLIGILYLLNQIKTRKLLFSEFIILTWFLSFFITISLGVESYNLTKYYVLMILPISLIMSYGFVKFINKISKNTIRIIFFVSTISAHAITYLVFWENIYFNSEKIWRLPYEINLQKSISEPITLISSLIFLSVLLIIIGIKLKSRYAHIKEN
jgi:4-amino-4-deoxy-L-arabinose transferase-like glycosyltransferase